MSIRHVHERGTQLERLVRLRAIRKRQKTPKMVKLHEGLLTKTEVKEQLEILFREAPSPSPIPVKKPNKAKEEDGDAQMFTSDTRTTRKHTGIQRQIKLDKVKRYNETN